MKYVRSPLVGRKELPEDRAAFKRLSAIFAGPATGDGTPVNPTNRYRRGRVVLRNGKTSPEGDQDT